MNNARKILAKISDPVFGQYIVKFKILKAYSKETAVTQEVLFPQGETSVDSDRMHKLLKSGVIKSSKPNEYWLDRKEYYMPDKYSKRRIKDFFKAFVIGIVLYTFWKIFK